MFVLPAPIAVALAAAVAALICLPIMASAQKAAGELPNSDPISVEPNVESADTESAIFAPNGEYLATYAGNRIRLWDIESGRPLRVLEDFAYINDVKIFADSRTIISSGKDGQVKYWDAKTGKKIRSEKLFDSDGNWFNSVREVPNANQFIFTASSGQVGLWDRKAQKTALTIKIEQVLNGYYSAVDARLSSDGRHIVFVSNTDDKPTVIAHVDRGTHRIGRQVLLPKGWQAVTRGLVSNRHVLASSNGSYPTCASNLALFEIKNAKPIKIFRDNSLGCPKTADGSPDYQSGFSSVNWFQGPSSQKIYVARAGRRGLAVWDLRKQEAFLMANWYDSDDMVLSFSAAIERIAIKRGATIEILNARSGERINTLRGHGSAARPRTTYDPDSLVLYTDDEQRHEIVRWSVSRIAPVIQRLNLEPGFRIVHSLIDANKALAVHDDGRIALMSSQTGQKLNEFKLRKLQDAWRSRLSPDGKLLLVKVAQNAVLLDVASQNILKSFKPRNFASPYGGTDEEYVTAFAFSNDGKRFGIGWWGGAAEVWDTTSLQLVAKLPRGDDQTTSLEFSGDGRLLIGGSRDSGIFVWHIKTRKLLQTLSRSFLAGHVSTGSAAISEDGQLVAAGPMQRAVSSGDTGLERRIHVWDTFTGKLRFLLKGHQSNVVALTFSSDRRWIVSADYSGTIRYWSRETGKLAATFAIGANGDWAIVTDVGFFAASSDAGDLLSVVRGFEAFSVEQLWQSLYNLDLVREYLTGDTNGEVAAALRATDLGKILDSGPAPTVSIASHPGRGQSARDLVLVKARITDRGKGVGRIEWRVNGVTAAVQAGPPGRGPEHLITQELALDQGDNTIEIVAYNGGNLLASLPARTTIKFTGPADQINPKLHILAIGINKYVDKGWTQPGNKEAVQFKPLGLAVKDATTFAADMKRAAKALSVYDDIQVTTVLDQEATRDKLERIINGISSKMHRRDTFILFAAAHGTSKDGRFYLIPQDYQSGPNSLQQQAIGQDRLQDWLANRITARKALILLDTCESGALVAGHLRSRADVAASEAGVGRLHEATGRPVLTAAAIGKPALEGYEGHGIFTWALLDALRNGDTNGNGKIELTELVAHVQDRIPKINSELQARGIKDFVANVVAAAARQSARFGTRGEDFVLAGRLR